MYFLIAILSFTFSSMCFKVDITPSFILHKHDINKEITNTGTLTHNHPLLKVQVYYNVVGYETSVLNRSCIISSKLLILLRILN